jgi:hypothetical protein
MNLMPTMPKVTPSELKKTISFHVSNLSAEDAVFLNSVIATFCDPNQNLQADAVRHGHAFISYGNKGKMIVLHRLDSLSRN